MSTSPGPEPGKPGRPGQLARTRQSGQPGQAPQSGQARQTGQTRQAGQSGRTNQSARSREPDRSARAGKFPHGAGERRRSRERALELTYEAEQKGLLPTELLLELPVAPAEYAVQLVTGLTDRLDDVDELVSGHSSGWAIDRMPAVDRCILRISTYELIGELDVPVAVVIDEAVELAKEYSTEDSPRFVNGVLAAIADTVRPAGPGGSESRSSSSSPAPSPAAAPSPAPSPSPSPSRRPSGSSRLGGHSG